MALNGLYPVIIFKIYTSTTWQEGETDDASKIGKQITLKEWQEMSTWKKLRYHTPVPIPIYLNEKGVLITCDEAEQNIDFSNMTIGNLQFQNTVGSDVVLNLKATSNNTVLSILMATIKYIMQAAAMQFYDVTVYYDSIFVMSGLIKSINQSSINNTNVKLIQLVISDKPATEDKSSDKSPIPKLPGGDSGPGFQRG